MNNFGCFSAIVGKSGSGKTSCFLIPQIQKIIKREESFVLTDPKNESLQYLNLELKKKNYTTVVLNLRDLNRTVTWNPLKMPFDAYRKGNMQKCYSLLNSIGEALFSKWSEKSGDPFWDNSAKDFFVGLAFALFEDASNCEEVNLSSIYHMAMELENKTLKRYFELKADELNYAYSCTHYTLNAPSDTRGGIFSTFHQKLRSFTVGEQYNSVLNNYKDSIDLSELLLKKRVAFIIQFEDEVIESAFVTNVFLQQIIYTLINERSKGNKTESCFHVFFEDFILLKRFPNIEGLLLAVKERNINVHFCISSLAILENIYGENIASAILDNCEDVVFTSYSDKKSIDFLKILLQDDILKAQYSRKAIQIKELSKPKFIAKVPENKNYYRDNDYVGKKINKYKVSLFSIKKYLQKNGYNNDSIGELVSRIDKRIAELEANEKENR